MTEREKDRCFEETLCSEWKQSFQIDEIIWEQKTEHQHLIIFQNSLFGRVMALDGIIQTTEGDEFIYHEMLAHVPLIAHGQAENVLIIGGGDGGLLREVVKHRGLKKIILVEIDGKVIETAKRFLPNHSLGSFADPRLQIVIEDGIEFVKRCSEKFDIILSDSTDPIGPGEVLFTSPFYQGCHDCLRPGGILSTQNGVPFHQAEELRSTYRKFLPLFDDVHFYAAAVPTYVGGLMAFGWATDNPELRQTPIEVLQDRFEQSGIKARYYTPEVHAASFALPQFILNNLKIN